MKNKLFINEFVIKIAAFLFMTLDHLGLLMKISGFAVNSVPYMIGVIFRYIGRLAFPLFAFMLAEGLRKTSDRKKYIIRIATVWACIAIIQTICVFALSKIDGIGQYMVALNVPQAFSILLASSLFIYLIEGDKWWKKVLSILPLGWVVLSYVCRVLQNHQYVYGTIDFSWITYFPNYLRTDYSLFGFLAFLGFYYAHSLADFFIKKAIPNEEGFEEFTQGPKRQSLINIIGCTLFASLTVVFWLVCRYTGEFGYLMDPLGAYESMEFTMSVESYALISIIFILFYNGQRGYDAKWFRYFSYLYYPVHITLLAAIFVIIWL